MNSMNLISGCWMAKTGCLIVARTVVIVDAVAATAATTAIVIIVDAGC